MQLKRFIITSLLATILVPTAMQTTQTVQASNIALAIKEAVSWIL